MAAEGLAPPAPGHAGKGGRAPHFHPTRRLVASGVGTNGGSLSALLLPHSESHGGGGAPTADVRVPEMSTLAGNISRQINFLITRTMKQPAGEREPFKAGLASERGAARQMCRFSLRKLREHVQTAPRGPCLLAVLCLPGMKMFAVPGEP